MCHLTLILSLQTLTLTQNLNPKPLSNAYPIANPHLIQSAGELSNAEGGRVGGLLYKMLQVECMESLSSMGMGS
jgi:hypothetical protein